MADDGCKRFSNECGADAWLQFDDQDPEAYQKLNGKCVVIVQRKGDQVFTDEYDPLQPTELLTVHYSKLRGMKP